MALQPPSQSVEGGAEAAAVRALYHQLLDGWNRRSADDYAALFNEDDYLVGFDGSPMNGRAEIAAMLRQIFADHPTAAYVAKVRGCTLPEARRCRAPRRGRHGAAQAIGHQSGGQRDADTRRHEA